MSAFPTLTVLQAQAGCLHGLSAFDANAFASWAWEPDGACLWVGDSVGNSDVEGNSDVW